MEAMTIGALGKATGIAPKTVRFYEEKGLLPRPSRTLSAITAGNIKGSSG